MGDHQTAETITGEAARLRDLKTGTGAWRRWGTYLAERAWGTVREDYSADGAAWDYFPHDHARSRVYRWNEDGLLGWSDEGGLLCFGLALWNGNDPILKERAFGLTNREGNHGEDVKELYYYLDNTPTHSYVKGLYKYPHAAFPYSQLIAENAKRDQHNPEYELVDTGVFDENRYFDVTVEYAKATPDDTIIEISVTNRGPEAATLDLLPTLWFRNTWSWDTIIWRPRMAAEVFANANTVLVEHLQLGRFRLYMEDGAELLFTENETNVARLFGAKNPTPFVKDGINEYIVHGNKSAVNPQRVGTKVAAHYHLTLGAGETRTIKLRLQPASSDEAVAREGNTAAENQDATAQSTWHDDCDAIIAARRREADEFYAPLCPPDTTDDERMVQRQAFAGLLWSKQYYHYNVRRWLDGDPSQPPPPDERFHGRNRNWRHLDASNVIAMPDTWEYPWFAAWDWAFHCLTLSLIDPEFAKAQLLLIDREWYEHPNGQLPAYEWAFGDVNPPVHAWASLRVYRIERRREGQGDVDFLRRVFHKLLLNFTWWVNRKDADGRNIFQGGFLGLDNIGIFDRSAPLPDGWKLDQADGTAWMAMYCLNMLAIALELARHDRAYEDVATKFLEHFFYIAHAINNRAALSYPQTGEAEGDLWDDDDGFYYDVLHMPHQEPTFIKVRSMVGLIPLLAVDTLDAQLLEQLPEFSARLDWLLNHRPDLTQDAASVTKRGAHERRLFAVVDEHRLRAILRRALDETEFLSSYGLRSISRYHAEHPYQIELNGHAFEVDYEPAESHSGLFGGNSNWRGPIWFPINYLLIEALQKFDYYYGDSIRVECPVGSGHMMSLWEVAGELGQRMTRLFLRDGTGRRPVFGANNLFNFDPHFRDCIPFHEYFHGDNGTGLGASHQTGWTALVAKLIQQSQTRSSVSPHPDAEGS